MGETFVTHISDEDSYAKYFLKHLENQQEKSKSLTENRQHIVSLYKRV